ncbi:hypothetical protein N7532_006568 [Penicillium argentinense]|uniref:Uncharacterized protein n=1 Tax=Penicillium argentinense TaxID=1131581 RepID=A0A9W9FG43_9EURO|nr:uncharacterized protein N7532_006568 [Penicillium argentinense]KAJ5099567.1 hypothetical protein N7532_006568 [Penicillium argentinense]
MRRNFDEHWFSNDHFFEWLHLVRGTKAIIASVNSVLKSGPLAPMFTLGGRKSRAREVRSTDNQPFMENLRQLLTESVKDPNELRCYQEALDDLAKSFAAVFDTQSIETADVFIWLYQISDEYLNLLRNRTPEALVIFGYFTVITKELEWAWWLQGFSVHLMRAIYNHLDQEHRYWLQWPIQQLGWVF